MKGATQRYSSNDDRAVLELIFFFSFYNSQSGAFFITPDSRYYLKCSYDLTSIYDTGLGRF